ncbi:MAG: HDOD domain-containing protein [Bdellovibrionota bacterium]
MEILSKSIRVIPDVATQRKAESTLAHIGGAWLPVNPILCEQIQEKFRSGEYANDRAQLVDDLCGDLSLLTHAVKFLRARVEEPVPSLQPLRELMTIDDSTLSKLMLAPFTSLSRHRLSASNRLKNDIFKTTFHAANAAHTIALQGASEGLAIQPENARFCTLFRQLGWNLIAWNYPSVLAGVLRSTRSNPKDTGRNLRKVLGMTPEELGSRYANDWLLAPELRDVIQSASQSQPFGADRPTSSLYLLQSACELGESFSRLRSPERFPHAEREWERKSDQLKALAPNLAVTSLQAVVDETTDQQIELMQRATAKARPTRVSVTVTPKVAQRDKTPRSFAGNQFLQKCPEHIQEQFRQVYDSIKEAGPCVEALQSLVTKAIPASGFASGIIYLLDQRRFDLVPAAKFGGSERSAHPKIKKLFESSAQDALTSDLPVRKEDVSDDGISVEHVSAAFGDSSTPGVLLLEVGDEASTDPAHNTTLYFKAIRQCLNDCLALSS